MKKILSTICGLACVIALVLACAENPDGSCNFVWSWAFLALSAISGWAYGKLDKEGQNNV